MIGMKVTWHGDRARIEARTRSWQGIVRAVLFLWTECQKTVSVANPRPYRTPSRPGEPPRLRTGLGRSQITYDLDEANLTGQVGVTAQAPYMAILETTTSTRRRRPWLLATALKHLEKLRSLAGSG